MSKVWKQFPENMNVKILAIKTGIGATPLYHENSVDPNTFDLIPYYELYVTDLLNS